MPAVITVAASNIQDSCWQHGGQGSNFGTCVKIIAPGENVTSAYHIADDASFTASGTSQACPHVSGVAAQYLESNPLAPPSEVTHPLLPCLLPHVEEEAAAPDVWMPNAVA